jgi:DNA modification methylase
VVKCPRLYGAGNEGFTLTSTLDLQRESDCTMVTYNFILPSYPLKPFEREIARLEVLHLAGVEPSATTQRGLEAVVRKRIPITTLRRMGSFERVVVEDGSSHAQVETDQHILEMAGRSVGNGKPSTRASSRPKHYLLHDLHSYKGRFYPQLIKPLINFLDDPDQTVLDPFVGCGTTLIESKLASMNSIGVDMNPLACFISKVKMECFEVNVHAVSRDLNDLLATLHRKVRSSGTPSQLRIDDSDNRQDSLKAEPEDFPRIPNSQLWFSPGVLEELYLVKEAILDLGSPGTKDFALLALSAIVKRVSNWDPGSVRQQLLKEPRKDVSVLEAFEGKLKKNLAALEEFDLIRSRLSFETSTEWRAEQRDSRDLGFIGDGEVDMVVTSPPYATALPYIDTDRLPMYVLGLLDPESSKKVKADLIGERDIADRDRVRLEEEFTTTYSKLALPEEAKELIRRILDLNRRSEVGFRRRNVAANLYRYFSGMSKNISELARVLRKGGSCAMVIGDNYTIAGGDTKVDIPTTKLLEQTMELHGLHMSRRIVLTPTPAYMRYANQMIQNEYIVIARR